MKHVILDTDIGGDPDDMFALLLALASPEIEVDLIVTNDEHQGDRARFANYLLELTGNRIPVIAGEDLGNTRAFVVEDIVDRKVPVDTDYLSKLEEVVSRKHHTEYVCIGPQRNLASFIDNFPELRELVRITIMGGAINYRHPDRAEHNVRYDIEAGRKVFCSGWDKRYVLSDVTFTSRLKIDKGHRVYQAIAETQTKLSSVITSSMDNFFDRLYPSTMMHDPLTLLTAFNPHVVDFGLKSLLMDDIGRMKESPDCLLTEVSVAADYDMFWDLFEPRVMKSIAPKPT